MWKYEFQNEFLFQKIYFILILKKAEIEIKPMFVTL